MDPTLILRTLAGPLREAKVNQIVNDVKTVAPRLRAHTAALHELIKNGLGVATGVQTRAELVFPDNTLIRGDLVKTGAVGAQGQPIIRGRTLRSSQLLKLKPI